MSSINNFSISKPYSLKESYMPTECAIKGCENNACINDTLGYKLCMNHANVRKCQIN